MTLNDQSRLSATGVVYKNKWGWGRVVAEADVLPVDRRRIELAGEPVAEPVGETAGALAPERIAERGGEPGFGDDVHSRVGDRLRTARERLGIGRAELSLRTKINERHLEALEDSDFTALPARIYAVGFARSYAGAVGLDAARIAAEVRRELNERENPPLRQPNQLHIDDPSKVPSSRIVWLSLALGALLILVGTVFWRSYFVPAVELPPVREDIEETVPELSPQAQISPTAESAVSAPVAADVASGNSARAKAAGASEPAPVAPRATPVVRTIAPSPQTLPAPVPEALEPAPVGATAREPL